MTTKLWLVSRKDFVGYDEYGAMVVAADTEEEALLNHPSGAYKGVMVDWKLSWFWNVSEDHPLFNRTYDGGTWCSDIRNLTVEYLGITDREIKGVILVSYNAG